MYVYAYVYICMPACVHDCMYGCMPIYMYACLYVCMHVCSIIRYICQCVEPLPSLAQRYQKFIIVAQSQDSYYLSSQSKNMFPVPVLSEACLHTSIDMYICQRLEPLPSLAQTIRSLIIDCPVSSIGRAFP